MPREALPRGHARPGGKAMDPADAVKLHRFLWEVFVDDLRHFAVLSRAEQESWISWVLGTGRVRDGLHAFSFRVTAGVVGYDSMVLRDGLLRSMRRLYREAALSHATDNVPQAGMCGISHSRAAA